VPPSNSNFGNRFHLFLHAALPAAAFPCHLAVKAMIRARVVWVPLLIVVSGMIGMDAARGQNRVELEIIADAAAGLGDNQRWMEALGEAGADNVRVVQSGRTSSQPGVEQVGNTWKVTGVLSGNRLLLPGGRFAIGDTDRIAAYISGIRADGADVALAEKFAFGLTAEQLVALHDQLTRPLVESTLGRPPADVVESARSLTPLPISVDRSAAALLQGDYTLEEELAGLSCGTALAAALRPLGLVLAPHRPAGGDLELRIVPSGSVEEFWPVGWPIEGRISVEAPKLFERIPVNVENYLLGQALPAIQKKMGMPFLYDRNSMALAGVDLQAIRVSLQSEQLSYQLILNRLIAQARPRMGVETRKDEAGTPFVWIYAR
jgi:hypothetical protein